MMHKYCHPCSYRLRMTIQWLLKFERLYFCRIASHKFKHVKKRNASFFVVRIENNLKDIKWANWDFVLSNPINLNLVYEDRALFVLKHALSCPNFCFIWEKILLCFKYISKSEKLGFTEIYKKMLVHVKMKNSGFKSETVF